MTDPCAPPPPCDVPHAIRVWRCAAEYTFVDRARGNARTIESRGNDDQLPGDIGLVVDSWRQSYRGARAMKGQHPDDYFPEMGRTIVDILSRPVAELVVAHDVDDPSLILGWACIEGPVLHYVWVRLEMRHKGIAKEMLRGRTIESCSHYPIKGGIPEGIRYRPFSAWR